MTRAAIIKDWRDLDLFRQTPGGRGVWDGVQFSEDPSGETDYAVVLNRPERDMWVRCPPHHLWAVIQEPPNETFDFLHHGDAAYARVYTSDERLRGERYHHNQPALAWRIHKSYDELQRGAAPEKTRPLSWVTSNKRAFRGHRRRMRFLTSLPEELPLDLFGYGFKEIDDKWDGLAPYRYSLAVENFSNSFYWSEKLADCFLAWTMPIYYGCTRITDYFPREALIQIDIRDPQAVEVIRAAVAGEAWKRGKEAIAQARELVLNRYQLFPFLHAEMREHEANHPETGHAWAEIFIPREPRLRGGWRRRLKKLYRRIVPAPLRRQARDMGERGKEN